MAFSQRRGRPPRPRSDAPDLGTPELALKRALGLTDEPIDRLLQRGLISPNHHWCALHLRWLYTLRYGAPVVTTRYTDRNEQSSASEQNPEWRSMREREYTHATALLKQTNHYEPVMRVCVFNELPAFLNPALSSRALNDIALANQLHQHHTMLLEGLTLLASHWRRRPSQPPINT